MATRWPSALFLANAFEFLFRRRLRHEIVHAGFGGDGGGGERIVARDHHGADAHFAQVREAVLDSAFHHVLQFDRRRASSCRTRRRAESRRDVRFHRPSSSRPAGKLRRLIRQIRARFPPRLCGRAWSARLPMRVKIDAAHAGLRGERNERGVQLVHFARAQSEFLFRQHDDAAAFGRFIGERTQAAQTSARSLSVIPGAE